MKNIILLNGPSLLNSKIARQRADRVFAVNRKNQIEKLFGDVNYWCLYCPREFRHMIDDVYEFLSRPGENRLITSTASLHAARDRLEARPLPNPHRIILIDSLKDKMAQVAQHDSWNSTAHILYLLALASPKTPTFIYGMDGAPNSTRKGIYFNEKELSEQRINESRIYEDMIFFDLNFKKFFDKEGLALQVYNMNHNSYYRSLPHIQNSYEVAVGETYFPYHEYSNKELLTKIELICRVEVKIDEIWKKIKKPTLFKRIIRKFKKRLS